MSSGSVGPVEFPVDGVTLIQDYAKNYGSMTEAKAGDLISRAFDLEGRRTALKRQYFEQFKEALGAVAAARFIQVENQLLMVIDLQIASSLPLVQ